VIATIAGHVKNPDYEYDTFAIDGHHLLFDPTTLSTFRVDVDTFDLLNTQQGDGLPSVLEPFARAGLFRQGSPPASGQWSGRYAGITLMNTNRCNLRCPYCVMDHNRRKTQTQSMTSEMARHAVDHLFDEFGATAERLSIAFSLTGEPFLNLPLMEEVAEYATQRIADDPRTLNLYLSTNATLISDRALAFLRRYAVRVNVSLDGDQVHHDLLRFYANGGGSYQRALAGARRLLDEYSPSVSCSPTLTLQNHNVTEIFQLMWDIGFRTIAMKPVRGAHDSGYAFSPQTVGSLLAEYESFAKWLLAQPDDALLTAQLQSLVPPNNDYFGRMIGKVALQTRDVFRCEAGKTDVAVDADGEIYSCFSVVGEPEMHIGTLEGGIDTGDFWKMGVDEREPCNSCVARYTCGGGCACTAFQANENKWRPDPVDCAVQIHLTRLACYLVARLHQERPSVLAGITSTMLTNTMRAVS
jgi:uncharacterized protein